MRIAVVEDLTKVPKRDASVPVTVKRGSIWGLVLVIYTNRLLLRSITSQMLRDVLYGCGDA